MSSCPFCHAPIDDVAARFGGRCPKCFIEIPGEEAPTNPAIQVVEPVRPKPSPLRGVVVTFTGLVMLLSLCVWWFALRPNGAARGASLLSDADFDSFYMVPLREIATAPVPAEAPQGSPDQPRAIRRSGSARGARSVEFVGEPAGVPSSMEEAFASNSVPAGAATGSTEAASPPSVAPALNAKGEIAIRSREVGPQEGADVDEDIRRSVFSDVRNYSGQIQACYERRLKQDPTLKGAWMVSIVVGTDGRPARVDVKGQGVRKDSELEECMGMRARAWRFQPLPEIMTFEIPYRLGM